MCLISGPPWPRCHASKVNMTFVDVDATYDELMEVFRSEKYTRYPVYEETTDNVIGVLNIKGYFS